jgi:plastocyanin
MKKLFVVLMILFVGILVCGCTSQTAAPGTTPTAAPTAAPAEVPTTAAPGTTPTAAPTAVPTTVKPAATPTPIPDQKIYITNTLTFSPAVVKIPVGTKVIWWTDAIGYKFKVGVQGLGVNFQTGIIQPGLPQSYTFTKAGTYSMSEMIYPQFHDDETKLVVV